MSRDTGGVAPIVRQLHAIRAFGHLVTWRRAFNFSENPENAQKLCRMWTASTLGSPPLLSYFEGSLNMFSVFVSHFRVDYI